MRPVSPSLVNVGEGLAVETTSVPLVLKTKFATKAKSTSPPVTPASNIFGNDQFFMLEDYSLLKMVLKAKTAARGGGRLSFD
jgi:hypothetical protein